MDLPKKQWQQLLERDGLSNEAGAKDMLINRLQRARPGDRPLFQASIFPSLFQSSTSVWLSSHRVCSLS